MRLEEATALLHDPASYVEGVPYAVLADLRREHGVVRVEEPEQTGWPEGPGYWLALRHADVTRVLRDPATFSSQLGGTQIRDPATEADLAFVRRMMLNLDPPEHSRIRRMLATSFTPRAVAAGTSRLATPVPVIEISWSSGIPTRRAAVMGVRSRTGMRTRAGASRAMSSASSRGGAPYTWTGPRERSRSRCRLAA